MLGVGSGKWEVGVFVGLRGRGKEEHRVWRKPEGDRVMPVINELTCAADVSDTPFEVFCRFLYFSFFPFFFSFFKFWRVMVGFPI